MKVGDVVSGKSGIDHRLGRKLGRKLRRKLGRGDLVGWLGAPAVLAMLVATQGGCRGEHDTAERAPAPAPATAPGPAAEVPAPKAIVSPGPPSPKLHFAGCTPARPPLPYFRPSRPDARGESRYQLAKQPADRAKTEGGTLKSSGAEGGAFASLTGTGDLSSGFDDDNIYGGLLGNEDGEMNGGFGYGRSGFGPGGGGTGWGTIGTGRYGTIGHGSGTGRGYGVAGGGMRGRTAAVPTVSIGQPSSQGDLDKAIIRRYIKRNLQKIQYCYEKRLPAKPALSGTVQAQFMITPDGTVATSTATGVDGEVSSCIAEVVKNIEFPKPKDGGSVQVNYPFIFRSGGGGGDPQAPGPAQPNKVFVARTQWTPFATTLTKATPAVASSIAEATATALAPKLAAIEACFPKEAITALRAMIVVKADGTTSARVGGAGDAAIEGCVGKALADLAVSVTPAHPDVEVACDAMRGDDPSWKVSPGAAYTAVEVTRTSLRTAAGESTFAELATQKPVKPWPALPTGGLYLVTIDADAPMANLVVVLNLIAAARQPAVVAVRAATGAPRFAFALDDNAPDPQQRGVTLRIAEHHIELCSATIAAPSAQATDPAAIHATLAAACKDHACSSADVLAAGDVSAAELLAATSAIRHAGTEQIRFVQLLVPCPHPSAKP